MRYVPRYTFRAAAEIAAVESGIRLKALTRDLSLFGCGLDSWHTLLQGARVKIKLVYDDAEIAVLAKVVHAQPELGMGVAFTAVEAKDERVLCGWIAKLASQQAPVFGMPCGDS